MVNSMTSSSAGAGMCVKCGSSTRGRRLQYWGTSLNLNAQNFKKTFKKREILINFIPFLYYI
jgi:uncharacterized membrane protein YvbJ